MAAAETELFEELFEESEADDDKPLSQIGAHPKIVTAGVQVVTMELPSEAAEVQDFLFFFHPAILN